jgi:hypothetical protein
MESGGGKWMAAAAVAITMLLVVQLMAALPTAMPPACTLH